MLPGKAEIMSNEHNPMRGNASDVPAHERIQYEESCKSQECVLLDRESSTSICVISDLSSGP